MYIFFPDAAENMRDLLSEITKKERMATAKRMGYLNNFSQVGIFRSISRIPENI